MYRFKVEKMNCKSCLLNIEDALKKFDSSIKIQADIANKLVMVETISTPEQIKQLIEGAGYPVLEVTR